MGASVIPFCSRDATVQFLLHRTFTGRRAGFLVDFGGGSEPGESHRQTAVREFIEETETMYFAVDPVGVIPAAQRVREQTPLVEELFERTLGQHPDWWCTRCRRNDGSRRDWKTFFIEIDYRDVAAMNREWRDDGGRRFVKRRELVWVGADTLRDYFDHRPDRLWKRLRQLEGASAVIRSVVAAKAKLYG